MSRMVFMAALVAYVMIFWDTHRLEGVRQLLSPVAAEPVLIAGAPVAPIFPEAGSFR